MKGIGESLNQTPINSVTQTKIMDERGGISDHETRVKIYRFKTSNDNLYEQMVLFADKNRFLNKADLKDAYEKWIEEPEIRLMILAEEELLERNCYDLGKNNITQKIFKSIKYYHIKKLTSKVPTNANTQKDKRKKEIVFSKELLESVRQVLQESRDLKPSQYYEQFTNEHKDIIEREKSRLRCEPENEEQSSCFDAKMKKMMKNQYYTMFQKNK